MATGATSFSVRDGEDSSSILHQRKRSANADEKCFRLRIERCVPLFEGNVQRRLEEFRCLRSGIADENVEVAELRLQLAKHLRDLFGLRHVGLHEETIGAAFADLLERLFRRSLVLEVVNADFDATLRQCRSNPSPDSARTASDQRRFSIEGHRTLLWLEVSEAKVSRAMDSRKFRLFIAYCCPNQALGWKSWVADGIGRVPFPTWFRQVAYTISAKRNDCRWQIACGMNLMKARRIL